MQLNFQKHGQGKPIFLLHGFPLDSKMWEENILNLIAKNFQVILPDLEFEDDNDSLSNTAEALASLLSSLKIDKAIIGGLSMGGYVCFNLYRLHPELFAGLILCDTDSSSDSIEKRNFRFDLIDKISQRGNQAVVDSMLNNLFSNDTKINRPSIVNKVKSWMLQSNVSNNISALKAMADRMDHDHILDTINIPTKIIFGAEDKITNLEIAEKLRRKIKNSELSIIPNAGHFSNLEQFALFNECLFDFVCKVY